MRKIGQRRDTIPQAEEALERCEEMQTDIADMIARNTQLMAVARRHTESIAEAQRHTELLAEARMTLQRNFETFDASLFVRRAARRASEDRPAAHADGVAVRVYRTDELIPFSGMFIVDSKHPLPRIVILRAGDPFPGCSRCAEVLKFRVLARHNLPGNLQTRIDKLPTIDAGDAIEDRR